MKTFTIEPTSWSYNLLALILPSYKFHKEFWSRTVEQRSARYNWWQDDPKVARDFCSYWRAVSFVISLLIVSAFVAYCTISLWFNLSDLSNKQLPFLSSFGLALGILGNAALTCVGLFFLIRWLLPIIARTYGKYLEWKDRNVVYSFEPVKEKNHPFRDACRTAHRAYKDNFCPMAQYANEDKNSEEYNDSSVESN